MTETTFFHPQNLLDATKTKHWELFADIQFAWEALPRIKEYLAKNLHPKNEGIILGQPYISDKVYIGAGTKIEPGAVIKGPAWIGPNCEIRTGAYIRDNVIVGEKCVLGNSCEFKNTILFDGCQVPHFSYVGDSILGAGVHLGAGVICSNLKLHGSTIVLRHENKEWNTGLRKFGAILGDHAEVGCNAVLNPGSVVGRSSLIYSGVQWRGVLPERSVVKAQTSYHISPRRQS